MKGKKRKKSKERKKIRGIIEPSNKNKSRTPKNHPLSNVIGNYEDNMVTRRQSKLNKISYYETKVWLISVWMITKQGLELMIIFQV